jgi:hypothetical protein
LASILASDCAETTTTRRRRRRTTTATMIMTSMTTKTIGTKTNMKRRTIANG